MSFMLVALAYVLSAGQPIDEPVRFIHAGSFASLDVCQAFLKSDEFGAEREQLAAYLKRAASARLSPPLKESEVADALSSGDPSIAITASCEPDNRL